MVVGRSQGGTTPGLPSLSADSSIGPATSASLRGRYHKKVPEISNQPLNTLLPILKDGAEHPEPYYITQNVVLNVPDVSPPWKEVTNSNEILMLENWKLNKKYRETVTESLIQDFIYPTVAKIVSSTVTESKASPKENTVLLGWIEENITSIVCDLAGELCWETLWDSARKMKQKEVDQLEKIYQDVTTDGRFVLRDAIIEEVLRAHFKSPLTLEMGQFLADYPWELLLYYTNRYMQRGSLYQNYAILKLQDQIITQVAGFLFINETHRYLEKEVDMMNQDEKFDHPPRKRKIDADGKITDEKL